LERAIRDLNLGREHNWFKKNIPVYKWEKSNERKT
jgi:hypothetical protein